jgi:hypothetical protein
MAAAPIELNIFNNKLIYKPIDYAEPNKLIKEHIQKVYSLPTA